MKALCLEDVLKSHCCLRHQTELSFCQNMERLIQSGSAELCGVMNQYFSCMLTSREVCRCVRRSGEKYNSECISTTVKHGGRGVMV